MRTGLYRTRGKRAIDVAVSLTGLALGWPALVGLGALVRWRLGSPVLFQQPRPGLRGEAFTLLKFRTMTDERGPDGELLPDGERLTPFGRLLRRSSLDELPELWNVLKGEMSLVGPRPLLMEYLALYSPWQMRRHEARPGITGWAQVHGRNAQTWLARFEYDVEYVDRHSLAMDLQILAMTVVQAAVGRGVSQEGEATMRRFEGNG